MSTNHNLFEERRAEAESSRGPSAYQPNTLPLGQTGGDAVVVEVLLYVHRTRRFIRDGSQDVHLDFHTGPELRDRWRQRSVRHNFPFLSPPPSPCEPVWPNG